MAGNKKERKYLAHFLDAAFIPNPGTTGSFNWYRIGQDLEAFAEELNPQVDVKKNILGEQSVIHNGYQVSSSVDTFYVYDGDALFDKLKDIANKRATNECATSRVEALLKPSGNTFVVEEAWREDCYVVPQSYGGDTSGVQIPFQVLNCGNRTYCTGSVTTDTAGKKVWTFTPTTQPTT